MIASVGDVTIKGTERIDGSTIHLTRDAKSYGSSDVHSATIAIQQEDSGKSDLPNGNSVGCCIEHVKGNATNKTCIDCHSIYTA